MKSREIDGQVTIDDIFMMDILVRNAGLVMHALADAQSYREDMGDEASAEACAELTAELEEFALTIGPGG